MLTYMNLKEIHSREPLNEFINVVDYVDLPNEEIYYTKNGYRGYAFEVNPSYYASVTEHKTILNLLEQNFPQNSAIQILSIPSRNLVELLKNYENFHNHFDKVKKPENLRFQNERRLQWLKKGISKGLINESYEFYPKNWKVILSVMIPENNNKGVFISDDEIVRYRTKTESKLRDFNPKNFPANELISLLSEILEPTKKEWKITWDKNTDINNQVFSTESAIDIKSDGKIEFSNKRAKDKKFHAKVLTTKQFPPQLSVAMTQDLFLENFEDTKEEPFASTPFFTCINIAVENKEKEKENLLNKSKATQWQSKLVGKEGMKYFPKLNDVAEEAEELNKLISTKNESIYRMQYAIIVMSESERKLEMQVEAYIDRFASINWILQEETENAFPVFMYSLPFQFDTRYKIYSQKFKTTLKGNNASATPLLTDAKGSYSKPLMLTYGRTGQIQFFDNFNEDVGNANIVMAAGSRAGKTFTILEYVSSSLKAGRMVRIIEAGANFEAICEEFGGVFLNFKEEGNVCLNFFTDAKTNKDGTLHSDVITTLVPLIGLMIGRKLVSSSDDEYSASDKSDNAVIASYIEKAVRSAFNTSRKDTGLYDVHYQLGLILDDLKTKEFNVDILYNAMVSLEPYALKTGAFYKYFNGAKDVYFGDNPLVVFELNDLKNKDEGLMFVILIALIQNVANEFYGEELEDILKSLICDEAWMLLDNPYVAAFLIRIWRTIGKHKGCGISISQDLELYYKNKDMEAIYHNSTYKILLKQDHAAIDGLVRDKKIHDNEFFIKKIKSLQSVPGLFSEMLIQVESSFYISRIIVDKFSFYLYSTPDKVPGFNEVKKQFGLQKNETAWLFSYMDENGCEVDEAHDELMYYLGRKEKPKNINEKLISEMEENIKEEEVINNISWIRKIFKFLKLAS